MSENPRRNPNNAFRAIADEGGLVVDPGAHDVKVLNPVGSAIYGLLDGTRDLDAIVRAVVAEFDVDEATARKDVEDFLADLRERGMLAAPAAEEASADGKS